MRIRRVAQVGTLVAAVAAGADGAGFQLYTEGSAEALGQGAAISGRSDLTSLAWYNPAALAGTDKASVMAGDVMVQIRTDFKSDVDSALNESMSDEWRHVPHAYAVIPVSDKWTGTLSVNAPYGLVTEWPAGWIGGAIVEYSELENLYITPSVGYRMNEQFAVSAGFNVVWAEAELTGTQRVVEGDDLSLGWTVAGHYQIADDWGLGVRYQSRVELGLEGTLRVPGSTLDASADLTLPSSVNIGLSNQSFKDLSLGLDLVWTEWSTYDQLYVVSSPQIMPVLAKDWEDVISIRLGAEYALGESWKLRGGYVWDESPVPDTTRAPELPGSDRQMLMAGLGWQGERIRVDIAYSYLWAEKVSMGTDVVAAYGLTGDFETTTHLVGISAGYSF